MATGAVRAEVASGSGERALSGVWLRRFAWVVVVYNVLVIVWGAVVRATGSGAGCGNHWPLCNGQVLPLNPRMTTVIEFTHRMMSGGTLVLIIALVAWVFRGTVQRHLARAFAVAGLLLTLNEALLGAMVIGVTGSLAALGDTLFPSTSLRSALTADFSSSAEWLVRLRILHPASAIVAGAFILWLLRRAVFAARDDAHRKLGLWLAGLLAFQFLLGGLDVLLRAPVWMQVLHLAGADAFWCVLVVLTFSVTVAAAPAARAS
ncbi:MAG TPA: COX15/CtaA family protein [Acidobacteriaceae bacterium]